MPEDDTTEQEQKHTHDEKPDTAESRSFARRSWFLPLLTAVILFGGFAFLYFGLDSRDEETKFWTPNALNVLLLMVIVFQAFIAQRQWDAMERQWKSMEGAIDEARTTREIENRPFVALNSIKLEGTLTAMWDSGKIKARVVFHNAGRTPARNVRSKFRVIYGGMTHDVKLAFGPVAPERMSQSVILPSKESSATLQAELETTFEAFRENMQKHATELANEMLAEWGIKPQAGKSHKVKIGIPIEKLFECGRVYIFGDILYEDFFGNARETKFCYFVQDINTTVVNVCTNPGHNTIE